MNKYVEAQNKWVAEVDLKIGDTVLIVGTPAAIDGCSCEPIPQMAEFIGTEQLVHAIQTQDSYNGIRCGGWWYPFYALIKKGVDS